MATEAIPQLLDSSVDSAGLSICSASTTVEEPRAGSMYNPLVLAGGVPIWFHALQDQGRYIALFRSHWTNATLGTESLHTYAGHTESGSCWVKVSPPTGDTVTLGRIPTRLPGEQVVNGAASRVDFLYTVGTLDGAALIQHHRVSLQGSLLLEGEELLTPEANGGVLFDKGCYIDADHLVVLGTDEDGQVYQCRRDQARIGSAAGRVWQYRGPKGWLGDITNLAPLGITSVGPVSAAVFKDRVLLATVAEDYTAHVFQARATDPWGRWREPGLTGVTLGDATTYLGGTMYLQPQLGRNPAVPMPGGATAAICYVVSTRVDVGAEQAIDTAWGLWSVASTV